MSRWNARAISRRRVSPYVCDSKLSSWRCSRPIRAISGWEKEPKNKTKKKKKKQTNKQKGKYLIELRTLIKHVCRKTCLPSATIVATCWRRLPLSSAPNSRVLWFACCCVVSVCFLFYFYFFVPAPPPSPHSFVFNVHSLLMVLL